MSQADKDRWDARYLRGAYEERTHPSALLTDWIDHLDVADKAPRAIDFACGRGRNTLFLARRGWRVDAVDISKVALERLRTAADAERLAVHCTQQDLETVADAPDEFGNRHYDLALLIRYTDLRLAGAIPLALKPGGYLIAEMHLRTHLQVAGPQNPRFRVTPGELRESGAELELLHYREGLVTDPDGRAVALAQMVARRYGR